MLSAAQGSSSSGSVSSHSTLQQRDLGEDWASEHTTRKETDWRLSADYSTTSLGNSSSSGGPQDFSTSSSLLFNYFSLLAAYHGAVHVPRYWEDLLLPFPVAPTEGEQTSSSAQSRREGDVLVSSATEIDLSQDYAGPTTLLALADVVRVHSVQVLRSYRQRHLFSTKKGNFALPVVMAPLWGAGSRRASKKNELLCSLMPHLKTLRLAHLAIDFTASDQATMPRDGCAVLRSLLEALQGHPSIRLLDISSNPVAAGLVPALSRLVQTTPSLTTLVLDDTLLTDAEKEMLHAQCLLNQLREQHAAIKGDVTERSDDSPLAASLESDTRALWLAQMREKVIMALERGITAIPLILGQYTALIRNYEETRASRGNAPGSERTGTASHTSSNTRKSPKWGGSSASLLYSRDLSFLSSRTYVNYEYISDGSSASNSETSSSTGSTWNGECVEVVRSAFMPRLLAQSTVLGGRPVWLNVPGPLEGSRSDVPETPSIVSVAATDLLLSLRQQVLPEPPRLPGIRLHSAVPPEFLTTTEHNYWTVRSKQETQWGYIVRKIVENLVPVSVRNGQTIYSEGDPCDMMYFLPLSLQDTATYGELLAGVDPRRANRVLPGQWVGDVEVLDCLSIYARHQPTSTTKFGPLPTLETSFQRVSALHIFTESSDGVTIWGLPSSVAFFYLYVPYQSLHKHFIKRTPMTAFADIHPVHLASLPVHLQPRHGCSEATAQESKDKTTPTILCTYAYMARHVLLLQEGEFILRLPSTVRVRRRSQREAGAATAVVMEERHLLSGVTLLTKDLLDLDAALRAQAAAKGTIEQSDSTSSAAGAPQGMNALGKEAALTCFRAVKAALAEEGATKTQSLLSEVFSTFEDDGSATVDSVDLVELRQHCTGGLGVRWRFSALTNEEFASFCPELRLALTHHYCIVHNI